jgi:hypothetical protein
VLSLTIVVVQPPWLTFATSGTQQDEAPAPFKEGPGRRSRTGRALGGSTAHRGGWRGYAEAATSAWRPARRRERTSGRERVDEARHPLHSLRPSSHGSTVRLHNDTTQLLKLVEAIPPVRGKRGRPRRRPKRLQADRGYDSEAHRRALKKRRSSQ